MNVLAVTGRLTMNPVRRDTARGVVCEFRLAVDTRPRLWLTVVCWGHLAGVCAQHLHAGRRVAISGSLQCDQYVTRAGDRAERWFVKADRVTFLSPKYGTDDEPRELSPPPPSDTADTRSEAVG